MGVAATSLSMLAQTVAMSCMDSPQVGQAYRPRCIMSL